ncbi:hypothetical protein [Microbaculum marinisediminis]|uniref:ATP-dependent Clp protease proteolytic subunit n=1 Tax=Microbaculum marinisediminis TaxID=2931392 RepID=A0AAW5QX53_9HYPH|nr:hypothetical protein [Microbaculum sp. A6E488]MCT8972512.1 hypothetical protein [Microbaculum sp. A6E488]
MSENAHIREPEGRIRRWLNSRPDEHVLLWSFRGLLVATFVVLGLDLADLQKQIPADTDPVFPGLMAPDDVPYLPSIREGRTGPVVTDPETAATLRNPATFELVDGGKLLFDGAIEPGSARRFAEEIEKRGGYIDTVVLNSPGGSVADALVIATLIREAGFNTEIGPGSYCASSCPLVFAGGRERVAAPTASIGVHRVFAADEAAGTPASGMDNAQAVSAECQRFLMEMGVDPRVWIHAMETPKDELFYFTPDELIDLKLATRIAKTG